MNALAAIRHLFGKGTHDVSSEQNYVKGSFTKDTGEDREAYFKHKKEHPSDDPKKLTPLQKRMHSGGA